MARAWYESTTTMFFLADGLYLWVAAFLLPTLLPLGLLALAGAQMAIRLIATPRSANSPDPPLGEGALVALEPNLKPYLELIPSSRAGIFELSPETCFYQHLRERNHTMPDGNRHSAVNVPALLDHLVDWGWLDAETRQQLGRHISRQSRLVQETELAQEAASFLYVYGLGRLDATQRQDEQIKAACDSAEASAQIDDYDQVRRKQYLELMERLGEVANEEIFNTYVSSRNRSCP